MVGKIFLSVAALFFFVLAGGGAWRIWKPGAIQERITQEINLPKDYQIQESKDSAGNTTALLIFSIDNSVFIQAVLPSGTENKIRIVELK